jgi:glutamate-1-semialdehyde 2,1-aminomutase
VSGRFATSEVMLRAALRSQATGPLPYAMGLLPAAGVPHYFRRARGAVLEDVDGNRLIDLHNAWGSAILGHGAPEVAEAVGRALRDGVVALPTNLEARVAGRLLALRPWGQSVRLAKTGSDAIAVAIRLARAWTGRDLIAVSGYHGWHDAVAAALPAQRGVPEVLRSLCQCFDGAVPDSLAAVLAAQPDRVAAVVLEPARPWPPATEALNAIAALARRHGAVVVHDEIASGLCAPCLQPLGVEPPDVAVLGKGLANGLPLAAVAGSRAVVGATGPDLLLFSGSTHDAVALAAADAVLARLAEPEVAAALARADAVLRDALGGGIADGDLKGRLAVVGHPGAAVLQPKAALGVEAGALRLLLVQELLDRGLYCLGPMFASAALDGRALELAYAGIADSMAALSSAVRDGSVHERLQLAATDRIALRR